MNIYLDVDGVLLDNGKPSQSVDYFLQSVLEIYPDTTYWLTTRCNGNAADVLRQIQYLFTPETQKLLEQIKPTAWPMVKTQAIDFKRPFLWFDDELGSYDKKILKKYDVLNGHIRVDLKNNPNQLQELADEFFK